MVLEFGDPEFGAATALILKSRRYSPAARFYSARSSVKRLRPEAWCLESEASDWSSFRIEFTGGAKSRGIEFKVGTIAFRLLNSGHEPVDSTPPTSRI